MGVNKESISKFLIENRFHAKLASPVLIQIESITTNGVIATD